MNQTSTRPDGISVLAVLCFILALMAIIGGIVAIGAKEMVIDLMEEQEDISQSIIDLIDSILIVVGIAAFIFAGLFFIAGWGLWSMKSWARILAIVLAIISLFSFPVGTVLGILILWYLFKPEIKEAFQVKHTSN